MYEEREAGWRMVEGGVEREGGWVENSRGRCRKKGRLDGE